MAKPKRIGLYLRRDFKWVVQFDESSKYEMPMERRGIHTLCGVKYLFGDNCAAFGWRYNPEYPKFVEILAKVRNDGPVCEGYREVVVTSIPIDEMALLHLYCNDTYYWFSCNGITVKVPKTHSQRLCTRLAPRFGGFYKAPHDITLKLKSL